MDLDPTVWIRTVSDNGGRRHLGFRCAAANGGDGAASGVPGELRHSRTCNSHLRDQRDEAKSMARCGALGWLPSPVIARRSRGRRRLRSVGDGGVVLARGKISEDVQRLRNEKVRRVGGKGGCGNRRSWPARGNYRRRCCGGSSLLTSGLAANRLGFLGREGEDEEGFL